MVCYQILKPYSPACSDTVLKVCSVELDAMLKPYERVDSKQVYAHLVET